MLKELNSIASGLLGLHGYPVGPAAALATTSERAPLAKENAADQAGAAGKTALPCARVVPVRARSYFAW